MDNRRVSIRRILLVSIFLPSCSLISGPSPEECEGEISVAVSSRVGAPTIDWSRSCAMTRINVLHPATETFVWAFDLAEDAPIAGPITYGRVPSGATVNTPASPLRRAKST